MAAEPLRAANAPTRFDQLVDVDHEARKVSADDGRRALEIVRERAADFGLKSDRVGLIGFSVGAAMAVDVAMDPQGPPPAFLAAIYGGDTGGRPIPANAPPLFTVVALDDRIHFRVIETLYHNWSAADLSAELHVFARGGHSFGMVRQGLQSDRWIDLLGDWPDRGFG
jgi:acetyl esterase/lipase